MPDRRDRRPRSHCPINFALELFGDKWSLLMAFENPMVVESLEAAMQTQKG